MSQITDEIQAGQRCAGGCSKRFDHAYGAPVVCAACWEVDPQWCETQGLRRAHE